MQVDMARWLSLVTRDAVASATASVETTSSRGTVQKVSEHRLHAAGLLEWSYTVRDDHGEVHHSCDGRELVQVRGDREPVRSRVPTEAAVDDPWYFYSWPGAVDAWFVEMLRPVDLLARIVVSTVTEPDASGLIRIEASPMGNEPSPYNGFALSGGHSLLIVLDAERGCLIDVTVTPADGVPLTYRLTQFT